MKLKEMLARFAVLSSAAAVGLLASAAIARTQSQASSHPLCPDNPDCPIVCQATRSTHTTGGMGASAEMMLIEGNTDLTVAFIMIDGLDVCDGRAKMTEEGVVDCEECWAAAVANYSQHTFPDGVIFEVRAVRRGIAPGKWSAIPFLVRSEFLRAKCNNFDTFQIQLRVPGGSGAAQVTRGVTLTCG